MQNYGVSILRLTTTRPGRGNRGNSTRDASNDQHDGVMCRVKRFCMGMIPPCIHRRDDQVPTSRSNRATSQKRAILYMAAGYALAWAFVCIPFMINFFVHESYATLILHVCLRLCLTPLQGLFNFLVFMSPKVRSAKQPRRGENLTWRQAFIKAYMSRGERRRTGVALSSRHIRTAGSSLSAWMQRGAMSQIHAQQTIIRAVIQSRLSLLLTN